MPRVLILGFGKMGRIHGKHLSEMGVPWDYHDPFVDGGVGLDRLDRYTHAIIATPIPKHYDIYRKLDGFPGRILIEKPVVVRPEHLHVLDDPRVFPGMCERFNPAVESLKSCVLPAEINSMEFCRTSLTGDVMDVGIHDLDLFCHILDLGNVPESWWDGEVLVASAYGVEGRFRWPVNAERSRQIVVATASRRLEADLLAQEIDGHQLPFVWPVRRELQAFLDGEQVPAAVSHAWLVQVVAR